MTASNAVTKTGVSVLIQHRVRAEHLTNYEQWLIDIIQAAAQFAGHHGVNILKPVSHHNQYEISVRFASQAEAEAWLSSEIRQRFLQRAEPYLHAPESIEISSGIDNWFQPINPHIPTPVRWKQWLLTTLVIWVLTMVVPPILAYLFEAIPVLGVWGIRHGITAAIIVGLVVYVIMPRLARALSGWLMR
ncbi:MAG: antibiotic biosynthesis monooxygenase [Pseudomonadota bacterium]|nr:antibiotic biosynthesis monooxygenase [Pseudomonadota bacterium]